MSDDAVQDAAAPLAISGELSIYRAAELRQWLLEQLQATPPGATLRISLAEVSEIDSSGAQLLLAAKALAAERGCRLQFTDHSPSVLELITLFDLAAQLDDPLLVATA